MTILSMRALAVVTTLLTSAPLSAHGAALRALQQQQNENEAVNELTALYPPQQQQQQDDAAAVQVITEAQQTPPAYDLTYNVCPDPMPTALAKQTAFELRKDYMKYYRWINRDYQAKLAPGTFVDDPSQIMTVLPEGDFILWGSDEDVVVEMSAYNRNTTVIREAVLETRRMRFVSPYERDFSSIEGVMELQGDHVVFVIDYYHVFAHFLIDMLPYLAYLRETVPAETRFLLADAYGHVKPVLEDWDPVFAERVDWIQCARQCKNQMVRVRNGSLTVFHPVSSTRHMDLYDRARRWIFESHPPKPEILNDPKQRTIVYYTRNNASAGHGRAMHLQQEQIMIQMINKFIREFERPEKLVIFEGMQSFSEQIELFQSANVVIGAHGGGLANVLFMLPSQTCQERPKVLEFLNNPLTPLVQDGSWARSYYQIYSTCPWVEYHHVLYVPPSEEDVTYVNMHEFKDSLRAILAPREAEVEVIAAAEITQTDTTVAGVTDEE
jgi:hypothetical protein